MFVLNLTERFHHIPFSENWSGDSGPLGQHYWSVPFPTSLRSKSEILVRILCTETRKNDGPDFRGTIARHERE